MCCIIFESPRSCVHCSLAVTFNYIEQCLDMFRLCFSLFCLLENSSIVIMSEKPCHFHNRDAPLVKYDIIDNRVLEMCA